MNASYKLALIVTLMIFAFVIGYYALQDEDDGGRALEPEAGPPTDQHAEAQPPADTEAATPLERPRLGQAAPPPPQRTAPAAAPDAPAADETGRETPAADDFMAELRQRQAAARDADAGDEPGDEQTGASIETPTEADRVMGEGDDAAQEAADLQAAEAPEREQPADAGTAELESTLTIGEPEASAPGESESEPEPEPEPAPEPQSAPQQTAPAPDAAVPATYTIQSGDTFSSLAQRFYDDERHWRTIAQANPTIDPARLRVGQEIRLPNPDDVQDTTDPDASDTTLVYTVRSQDTLGSIARQHYGSSDKWRVIYDANRETIGPSPDRISEGMELRIPPAPHEAE